MGKVIEETGNRYGRLTVLESAGFSKTKWSTYALWLCRCDRGKTSVVPGKKLRNGHTRSCGCYAADRTRERATTHGQSKHPLFMIWRNIRERCLNSNSANYEHYGERGIQIYESWKDDPEAFILWIEENLGPRPDGMSLDRIDNDGNYEPGNLRWATRKQQRANQHSYRIHPQLHRLLTQPIVFEYCEVGSDG